MTQFMLLVVLLLIVSSFIINGWYSITRGRWEVNPDGTKYWTGKIFNFWHKFLQQHTVEVRFYQNEEWLKQFAKVKEFFKEDEIIEVFESGALVKLMNPKKAAFLFSYCAARGISVSIREYDREDKNEKASIVSVFKDEKIYKFPVWLRDPLGECINCMASFYGSILFFFWLFIGIKINEIAPTEAGNVLLNLGWFYTAALWVLFCTLLAHLNEYILNLNTALKK